MKEAVHFHTMRDLQQIGILPLTGEACKFSMRTLCDLNEKGADLFRAFIGLPHDAPMAGNWNSAVNGDAAVASAMIGPELFKPLVLFYAWRTEALDVFEGKDGSLSIRYVALTKEQLDTLSDVGYTRHRNPCPLAAGTDRHTHAFSGRTT